MAEGTKLNIVFNTSEGTTSTYNFGYADEDMTVGQVKAVCNAMIANTDIYEETLVSAKSAKTVITSEIVYDLSADDSQKGYTTAEAMRLGLIDEDGNIIEKKDRAVSATAETVRTTTRLR